jgi:hypothetical protein
VYSAFIESQVKAEHERRPALESRGVGVITSSGAFATLLFGVVALVRGNSFTPTTFTKWVLAGAVVAPIGAGGFGLWASQLIAYRVAKPKTLTAMVSKGHWWDDEATARHACAVATLRRSGPCATAATRKRPA